MIRLLPFFLIACSPSTEGPTTADTGLFVAPIQDDDDEGGGWGKAACGCASVEEGRPVYGLGWVFMMLAMIWRRRQPGLGPTGRL